MTRGQGKSAHGPEPRDRRLSPKGGVGTLPGWGKRAGAARCPAAKHSLGSRCSGCSPGPVGLSTIHSPWAQSLPTWASGGRFHVLCPKLAEW